MKKLNIVFGIFLLLALSGCNTPEANKNPLSQDSKSGSENPQGFFGRLDAFNEPYKKALFATGQEKTKVAQKTNKEALEIWESLESEFKTHQPQRLKNTKNWSSTMAEIGDHVRASEKLISEGKLKEAHEELEQVRKKIRMFREENNITNLSDLMLAFHDTMEEVVEKEGGKDAAVLEKLDTELTPISNWEELQDNSEYQAQIKNLKETIKKLQASEGETYQERLQKLKPAFIQLYLQFG